MMRRFLLSLFVAMQLLLPAFSYATAFPVIQPTIQIKFPTIYPNASSMPSGGGGTGSINDGKGIAAGAVGAAAAAVCLSVDCASSVATGPSGVATPPGWVKPSPTAVPQPPGSVPLQGPVSWQPGGDSATESEACAKVTAFLLAHSAPSSTCTVLGRGVIHYSNHDFYISTYGGDSCPAGYKSNSSGSCSYDVSGASGAVQKPAGTPCQVLTDGGSVRWDTANPACAAPSAGPYWTDSDGNQESMNNGTLSVVSSDGRNKTNVGPAAGNSLPIIQTLTGPDSTGQLHDFKSTTTIDSYGNIATQDYSIDGHPVSQDEYNKTLAGPPPTTSMENSKANTNAGTGSNASGTTTVGGSTPQTKITCSDVNTCGVAQDGTLKDVGTQVGNIQTSFSDFIKNFTTVVQVPRLYTPSTDTAQSALSDFSNSIKNTALVSSVTGFFDVSLAGGSCPTWTIPVVNIMGLSIGGIEIDQFCTPTAYNVYSIASIVILVVCGFFAFRVAVDN